MTQGWPGRSSKNAFSEKRKFIQGNWHLKIKIMQMEIDASTKFMVIVIITVTLPISFKL